MSCLLLPLLLLLLQVYDFGGGTLDVSLLYVHKGFVTVSGTDGDEHLGGEEGEGRRERGDPVGKVMLVPGALLVEWDGEPSTILVDPPGHPAATAQKGESGGGGGEATST